MTTLRIVIPQSDIAKHSDNHETEGDIGIQVTAIIGKQGDAQTDHSDMLQNVEIFDGRYVGFMEVTEPSVLDNLGSIRWRVQCRTRRDDGGWHVEPFADWVTDLLEMEVVA